MNGGDLRTKPFICWRVSVYGSGRCIVSKAEPVPVASPPFVEKALVCAVPTAFCFGECYEFLELVFPRGQDHETRIEYVRPAHIGYRREIMRKCEKVRECTNWKDIGIQKNYFGILSEAKNVKFREDSGEIRAA
jgi:hypothetical protein